MCANCNRLTWLSVWQDYVDNQYISMKEIKTAPSLTARYFVPAKPCPAYKEQNIVSIK